MTPRRVPAPVRHYDPLELLTLDELADKLRRSRRQLERDVAAGLLRTVKLGKSTRVPRAEAERYLEQLTADLESADDADSG